MLHPAILLRPLLLILPPPLLLLLLLPLLLHPHICHCLGRYTLLCLLFRSRSFFLKCILDSNAPRVIASCSLCFRSCSRRSCSFYCGSCSFLLLLLLRCQLPYERFVLVTPFPQALLDRDAILLPRLCNPPLPLPL